VAKEEANVDEPVQPSVCGSSESEATSELQCEAATFVAQEGSKTVTKVAVLSLLRKAVLNYHLNS